MPHSTSARRSGLLILGLVAGTAAVATLAYVVAAWAAGYDGFPLDDAWIHQTYARNLAASGQLAYVPGQPSAGSTSPAWSFVLSVGYLLGFAPRTWATLCGVFFLAAGAWFLYRLAGRLLPRRSWVAALLAGLLFALEWHMVWAAASGMETAMFTALSLALLDSFFVQIGRSVPGMPSVQKEEIVVGGVGLGLLAGALVVTRPEGLGLAALVLAGAAAAAWPAARRGDKTRLLAVGVALLCFVLLLVPYVAFNLHTSGTPWPNTFYAKNAEYDQGLSLPARVWQVLSPTLIGPQILLLPGLVYGLYLLLSSLRTGGERHWPALLPLAWWLAFVTAYVWRLPVSYQHGRYSMPTIPLLLLYGTWGTAALLRPRSPHLAVRVVSRVVPLAVALLALVFVARGALAYRDDVAFVENEMVATAHWLQENTAPDDILAVHDIGAIGYYTDHKLLDLAGLINPEVIPFMTDAQALLAWMIERGADYAAFFPDFSETYAQLAADPHLEQVHCTDYAWTQAMGHANMCVYRIHAP